MLCGSITVPDLPFEWFNRVIYLYETMGRGGGKVVNDGRGCNDMEESGTKGSTVGRSESGDGNCDGGDVDVTAHADDVALRGC